MENISVQLQENLEYIRTQTLAENVDWQDDAEAVEIELDEGVSVRVHVVKN